MSPETLQYEYKLPYQDTGRYFPVIFYKNPNGYTYRCRTCGGIATNRFEIYSHLYEPQGSEYYCDLHIPPKPDR